MARMILALLLFAVGVVVGYLIERWKEPRLMRRLAATVGPRAPISTTPPTVATMRTPDWGPNLVECPLCPGAAMSQAALNEHLRARHGDS